MYTKRNIPCERGWRSVVSSVDICLTRWELPASQGTGRWTDIPRHSCLPVHDGSAPPPRLSTTTHHSSQWHTWRISSSSSSFYHNTSQQPVVHSTDQLLLLVFLPQHITAASGTLRRQFSCMQYASTLSYLCNQTPVMECVCSWTLDSSYKFDYHCYHQYYPLQSHRIMWPFWLFISLFVCMFVCKITRKVAGRLGWSFQGKFILG